MLLISYFTNCFFYFYVQEKSAKAKASANQNKDPARVGRSGYIGKEAQWEEDMAELVEEYPELEGLQCVRSVKHVLGRLVLNKETGKKELTEAHRERLKQLVRTIYLTTIFTKCSSL